MTCVCVWFGVGGGGRCCRSEWVTGFGLGFTNFGETLGKWNMCLCFGCSGVCGVWREWVGGLGLGGWCYVRVCCESLC